MKLMADMNKIIIIFLCLAVVIAFFFPWVTIKSPDGKGSGFITRGFRMSLIRQSPDANYLFGVGEKVDLGRDYINKHGKLVWVYPLLALIILCLIYLFAGKKLSALFIAISSFSVVLIGLYKVATANLEHIGFKLVISYGLWITLYAYLGIGIISALILFGKSPKKAKR